MQVPKEQCKIVNNKFIVFQILYIRTFMRNFYEYILRRIFRNLIGAIVRLNIGHNYWLNLKQTEKCIQKLQVYVKHQSPVTFMY